MCRKFERAHFERMRNKISNGLNWAVVMYQTTRNDVHVFNRCDYIIGA